MARGSDFSAGKEKKRCRKRKHEEDDHHRKSTRGSSRYERREEPRSKRSEKKTKDSCSSDNKKASSGSRRRSSYSESVAERDIHTSKSKSRSHRSSKSTAKDSHRSVVSEKRNDDLKQSRQPKHNGVDEPEALIEEVSKESTSKRMKLDTNLGDGCSNVDATPVLEKTPVVPQNRFGNVEVKKNQTYYRSNLKTAFKDINTVVFDDVHLRMIKRTPFWLLFDAIRAGATKKMMKMCNKYEEDVRTIIRCFDSVSGRFVIGGQYVELTSNDAKVIFGISCGTEKLALNRPGARTPRWVKRCFRNEIKESDIQFHLYKPTILTKIVDTVKRDDEFSITDTARLVHCYLLAAFLAPNQNGSINVTISEYVEDFDNLCKYDWSGYVVDVLKNQLKGSLKLKCGGCVLMMLYWLCEHSNLVERSGDSFPRFLNWDMRDVNYELSVCALSKIKNVSRGSLVLKEVEVEALLSLENYRREVDLKEKPKKTVIEENSNNVRVFYEGDQLSDDEVVEPTSVMAKVANEAGGGSPKDSDGAITDGGDGLLNVVDNGETGMFGAIDNDETDSIITPERGNRKTNSIVGEDCTTKNTTDLEFKIVSPPSFNLDLTQQCEPASGLGQSKEPDVFDQSREFVDGDGLVKVQKLVFDEESEIHTKTLEMSQLENQLQESRVQYERELSIKDELILRLKAERDELQRKCDESSAPTFTQMCADPVYLACTEAVEKFHTAQIEIDRLVNVNAELMGRIRKFEVGSDVVTDNSALTPSDKGEQISDDPDPSSMVVRVKDRTTLGERKAILFSPQVDTNEMVKKHEGVIDVDDAEQCPDHGMNEADFTFTFDETCVAVTKITGDIRVRIETLIHTFGKGNRIWECRKGLAVVTLEDILKILHNERISGLVIDAWSDMIGQTYEEHNPLMIKTGVFTSACWGLINNGPTRAKHLFKLFIDDPLEASLNKDYLLFPMNAVSNGRSTRLGDHWTMLKLNMRNNVWKFYNSMPPRDTGGADQHLNASVVVAKYVDSKLRSLFKKKNPKHPFLLLKFQKPVLEDCIEQVPESVDCGICVCYLIETLMNQKRPRKDVYNLTAAGKYRAKMATWFMDQDGIKI